MHVSTKCYIHIDVFIGFVLVKVIFKNGLSVLSEDVVIPGDYYRVSYI